MLTRLHSLSSIFISLSSSPSLFSLILSTSSHSIYILSPLPPSLLHPIPPSFHPSPRPSTPSHHLSLPPAFPPSTLPPHPTFSHSLQPPLPLHSPIPSHLLSLPITPLPPAFPPIPPRPLTPHNTTPSLQPPPTTLCHPIPSPLTPHNTSHSLQPPLPLHSADPSHISFTTPTNLPIHPESVSLPKDAFSQKVVKGSRLIKTPTTHSIFYKHLRGAQRHATPRPGKLERAGNGHGSRRELPAL
ncbi:hypothetical protein Pmani_039648 [Petrolisthes manimaculis]|uniref:Uncharacterized protein n=1 Tax=Petrolisthes manimaculis TaxID=1843537 RepID=A0AAE1NDT7_9EUCA|nr:hypothetical protein Pmani_039648 [Petrolisthes manimaculis]